MKTLEQQRAEHAWKCVQGCDEKYTALAKGAPALIMSNGLMQSLAFYASKGKNEHIKLNADILGWLNERELVNSKVFSEGMNDLYRGETTQYRRATQETLDFLKWIRHFAPVVKKPANQ